MLALDVTCSGTRPAGIVAGALTTAAAGARGPPIRCSDDRERLVAGVALLGPDDWQLREFGGAPDPSGLTDIWSRIPTTTDHAKKTRVYDGACVFLQPPGFLAARASTRDGAATVSKPPGQT